MTSFQLIPQSNNYYITNENGKQIDASIYIRVNNENEELILFFEDVEIENAIIIVPKLELIGLLEGGKKKFTKIDFIHSLLQKSQRASNYTIINNLINNDLIEFYNFTEREIEFNTFWEFDRFGKRIIVKEL